MEIEALSSSGPNQGIAVQEYYWVTHMLLFTSQDMSTAHKASVGQQERATHQQH